MGEVNDGALVEKIVSLAKEGKVEVASFIAGKTTVKEVRAEWGEPQHETEANQLVYKDYPNQHATIGYKDGVVNDLRSMGADLAKIHYQDIVEKLGKADRVSYYKDASHNQMILQYNLNSNYQLKWILPKPTNDNQNPAVDHTSVVLVPDTISNMSLEEKIGQMVIAGISGTSLQPEDEKLIKDYHVGGLIFYGNNLQTPEQTKQFVNRVKGINQSNQLPLFISVDQEGGRISRLPGVKETPSNEKIGEMNDAKYAYKMGQTLGKDLKSLGFNLDFAPVLDINSNPNNPVIGDRSYGNNPSLVSKLGIQTMKGIQSEKIISVIKHFPGHGDTSVDSHVQLPVVTKGLSELQDLELVPFKKAIHEGADVVMVAHILLPKLDDTYPAFDVEERDYGYSTKAVDFNGVVMTDDMTMGAVIQHFGIGEAAVDSILAGSDIILIVDDYRKDKSPL